MEYKFDFTVSGLDQAHADQLLAYIVEYVEEQGGQVGGGFAPVAADDGEVEHDQENAG